MIMKRGKTKLINPSTGLMACQLCQKDGLQILDQIPMDIITVDRGNVKMVVIKINRNNA